LADFTGMIFQSRWQEYKGDPVHSEYWLVTGPGNTNTKSSPVTKCSATGKMFKSQNGYSDLILQELLDKGSRDYSHGSGKIQEYRLIRKPGQYDTIKADIETSTKITTLKNRINYLENEIQYATKELAKAKATLEHLEMWKKGDVDDGTMHFGVSSSLLED